MIGDTYYEYTIQVRSGASPHARAIDACEQLLCAMMRNPINSIPDAEAALSVIKALSFIYEDRLVMRGE